MNSPRTIRLNCDMKLAVVTGTRAEYGILRPLLSAFEKRGWSFELYVTGSHLSPRFGLTVHEIEDDGHPIAERIDIGINGDTPAAVTHSMGLALAGFGKLLERRRPDLLFILGDRFEALAVSAAAQVVGVPIAHLHGGEVTEGAIDEAFRHSITKMSHLHFTATEGYRRRVIQLGEAPDRVFVVGALGLDNLQELEPMNRVTLESDIGFRFRKRNVIVTQHPLTLNLQRSKADLAALLDALRQLPELGVVITAPNADPGSQLIAQEFAAFAAVEGERVKVVASLGTRRYFSLLRHVDAIVGNSSSGLIEAPSFGIATVNIGDRQKGRLAGPTVISVPGEAKDIISAITQALSPRFRRSVAGEPNPYGIGNAAEAICKAVDDIAWPLAMQKRFHDLL